MTRISPSRQGLVLYQNLSCKAWTESKRLDLDLLSSGNGVAHLVEWIKERYSHVQVTQVGKALSDFFRKLRKKPDQSIRHCVGAQARLEECGCSLPNIAQAWVFIDRMNLEEPSELNLLASAGQCLRPEEVATGSDYPGPCSAKTLRVYERDKTMDQTTKFRRPIWPMP